MERYTVKEIENNQFYQMPKFLFEGKFKTLSNDARVLYSLLRDRHQLSIKNNWVNDNNEVYMIYTRNDMANMLGISNKTVLKAINKLKEFKLFDEVRQGINKPNLIYLTHVSLENTLTCKNSTSGHGETTHQDMENLHGSNTDLNKTDISKTENLHHLSELADDIFIEYYINIMKEWGFRHKRITTENLEYIKSSVKDIEDDININIWTEEVNDHFHNLSKNGNDDGDILLFLKASYRHFNIEL